MPVELIKAFGNTFCRILSADVLQTLIGKTLSVGYQLIILQAFGEALSL
jgi:hypothetical protein